MQRWGEGRTCVGKCECVDMESELVGSYLGSPSYTP